MILHTVVGTFMEINEENVTVRAVHDTHQGRLGLGTFSLGFFLWYCATWGQGGGNWYRYRRLIFI